MNNNASSFSTLCISIVSAAAFESFLLIAPGPGSNG
jgi:hypothetical protein